MASPFEVPGPVITAFKDKIEAVTVQGDRLYIGTATGNLHIYSWDPNPQDGEDHTTLIEVKKGIARKSIEQIGFIKDINSLAILSESTVTLYPLPGLTPPTPLAKAKPAFSFGVHTSIQRILPGGKEEQPSDVEFGNTSRAIPTLVTQLLVGCRRKVVLYWWKDGEPQDTKECVLPHTPRMISFFTKETVCLGYSPAEYAILDVNSMTVTDVAFPAPSATATTGMGALTGIAGYMTLGLGARTKPSMVQINETEVLIAKENEGITIGVDAKPTQSPDKNLAWPAPPDELAFVQPYIFSILPGGTVPDKPNQTQSSTSGSGSGSHFASSSSSQPAQSTSQQPATYISNTVLQIRSSVASSLPPLNIPFPFNNPPSSATEGTALHPPNANVRLLATTPASTSGKLPSLFVVSTPVDRGAAASEGSSVWRFAMKSWERQVDELVVAGAYADALSLLNTIDANVLSDKNQRVSKIRALNAVAQFQRGEFDSAIDTFIALDVNPAKIVALFPEAISGRLAVPREGSIALFGGPVPVSVVDPESKDAKEGKAAGAEESHKEVSAGDLLDGLNAATESIRGRWKTGLGSLVYGTAGQAQVKEKEDDAASIASTTGKRKPDPQDILHKSVEVLVRYLGDRRPKVAAALEAVSIRPSTDAPSPSSETSLSKIPVADLLGDTLIPAHAPLNALTPNQLVLFAQIVDTALFKSYLVIRPALLGSLCRVQNWCEVTEVEEELRARKKFSELKDLYHGKKMHSKALELLRQQSEEVEDPEDKLTPSISYLQKLGPEHLTQVFDYSRWMFEVDRDLAFEIFTSEDVELPRPSVADFLEGIAPELCVRFLEFLVRERGEVDPAFHDRLAMLYLNLTRAAQKRGDADAEKDAYGKFLEFIDSTEFYHVDKLYARISSEDLFEARAILLGKLGRHDQALELYVYKLSDYVKAEEYCRKIYVPDSANSDIYLTLLRIYLQPSVTNTQQDLLQPALELISRHGRRIDAVETVHLLPPLVTAQDVKQFLVEALRAPVFDTKILRQISKARNDQLSRKLMGLQSRRVKVTDSRICPNCHKRLGTVVAVHSPRGEVTHYQCRESFVKKLKETRR